jgi:vitamin B12/bleomycin/antimicrobial peptide transport system ATP-binding/permease protein
MATTAIPLVTTSYRSFLRKLWHLTYPYWKSEERYSAWALLIAIVGLNLGTVYLNVLFNSWNQAFYDALQKKAQADFWHQLKYFCLLAFFLIVVAVYRIYLTQMLEMRWRRWLTQGFLRDWLSDRVYYRMELTRATDNPDQRISEDLKLFTDGTLSLSLGLLNSVVSLASFVGILWGISGPLTFSLGGHEWTIPGYMVWAALIYALAGSFLSHWIGRPLIGLNFQQERYEANFRFGLVRLRENAEGIALYAGEGSEGRGLQGHFANILGNWWNLIKANKRLTWFTSGYNQIAIVFPYMVAAPRYFADAISFGTYMQVGNAFGEVRSALSWFVDSYGGIASWKASVDRLLTFHQTVEQTGAQQRQQDGIQVEESADQTLRLDQLDLALPSGQVIVSGVEAAIKPGEHVLLTGPSGSGKSTIFRAIAGIWPFGRGTVKRPKAKRVLFLPQKPYLPIGTLRETVSYPSASGAFSDAAINEALAACQLDALAVRLDESQHWAQQLSPGEQQRLAFARALLHAPDWLFLDEASSALDEATEQRLYSLLQERLPHAAIVSIAHRPALSAFHQRRFTLEPAGEMMRLASA